MQHNTSLSCMSARRPHCDDDGEDPHWRSDHVTGMLIGTGEEEGGGGGGQAAAEGTRNTVDRIGALRIICMSHHLTRTHHRHHYTLALICNLTHRLTCAGPANGMQLRHMAQMISQPDSAARPPMVHLPTRTRNDSMGLGMPGAAMLFSCDRQQTDIIGRLSRPCISLIVLYTCVCV